MTKLANKVAIVTGAGGAGSGRATALRFAREGAVVVASDINEEGGAQTVRLIDAEGGRALFLPCDVRDEASVRDLIAYAEEQFGPLDTLVNAASPTGLFRPDKPLEFWDEIIATDLLGALWLTRHAIEAMRRGGKGGAIVLFSSTSAFAHGRVKGVGSPAYDVAKVGVARLATALGFLGPQESIRVNCIAPDWIAVPGPLDYWNSLSPGERRRVGVPQRLTTPDEIAEQVLLLAIDETLHGRVMVWWSDDAPKLIAQGDPGYAVLE
jgi:NAD(P)-dependent dehydrogenase (short-subunit alcohol dehydrogenase family)